jgi:hypothetical protein
MHAAQVLCEALPPARRGHLLHLTMTAAMVLGIWAKCPFSEIAGDIQLLQLGQSPRHYNMAFKVRLAVSVAPAVGIELGVFRRGCFATPKRVRLAAGDVLFRAG